MSHSGDQAAVLFADISGSTRLYEASGDARAFEMVSGCIARLSEIVQAHKGTIIKSMGDGLMASFANADGALTVASFLQQSEAEQALEISVGFDFGPVIEQGGDVFGDTVNVAARLSDLARGGEILMTEKAVDLLSPALRSSTAFFDRMYLKGRTEPLRVYRFEPPQADRTEVLSVTGVAAKSIAVLQLSYRGAEVSMSAEAAPFLLGRGEDCDLQVAQTFVSRRHAVIEFRRGNFHLTDQSTNGTYIVTEAEDCVQLKRETVLLTESGLISLGRRPDKAESELVRFRRMD